MGKGLWVPTLQVFLHQLVFSKTHYILYQAYLTLQRFIQENLGITLQPIHDDASVNQIFIAKFTLPFPERTSIKYHFTTKGKLLGNHQKSYLNLAFISSCVGNCHNQNMSLTSSSTKYFQVSHSLVKCQGRPHFLVSRVAWHLSWMVTKQFHQ